MPFASFFPMLDEYLECCACIRAIGSKMQIPWSSTASGQLYNGLKNTLCHFVSISVFTSLYKISQQSKYLHLLGWPLFLGIKRVFRQNLMYLIQLQLTVSFFDTFTDNYGQEYLQCTFTVILPVGPSPYSLNGVQLQFTGLLFSLTKVLYTSTAEVSKLVSSLQNR